ncbi:transketolase C-terminal domain-containing protein [Bacillus fonticola]|uniref:transketolase C-terminal domain-containing protein n=1 Tax=Bacillus fonticola TaxID=2728853 RepID=UPI001D1474A0|nr:transketolase C-terminal domain-containing protein [Bacillus fonticola]
MSAYILLFLTYSLKPIDKELITQVARATGRIITAENHNVIGGLGSAVSEVLGEKCPVPIKRIGVHEQFGQVGNADYLQSQYKLRAVDIVGAAKQLLNE